MSAAATSPMKRATSGTSWTMWRASAKSAGSSRPRLSAVHCCRRIRSIQPRRLGALLHHVEHLDLQVDRRHPPPGPDHLGHGQGEEPRPAAQIERVVTLGDQSSQDAPGVGDEPSQRCHQPACVLCRAHVSAARPALCLVSTHVVVLPVGRPEPSVTLREQLRRQAARPVADRVPVTAVARCSPDHDHHEELLEQVHRGEVERAGEEGGRHRPHRLRSP